MHKKDRWTLHRRLDSIQGIFTLCITNIYRSKTIYTISYVSKTYYQYTMLRPKRHNREILSIFPKNFLFRLIIVCFPRGIRPTATVEYGCNKLHDAVGIKDVLVESTTTKTRTANQQQVVAYSSGASTSLVHKVTTRPYFAFVKK